ncbi:hypothetical protein JOB18_041167 [Solea senegalensis]|uniref:Transmembrane protein 230 n=1 Tax=Solea senegalensis TaxID=28829 RepID=A0AAV6R4J1_SOLSE|nr:hypothetical protein JOB18_041167 [Solea senegalensis]
MKAARSNMLGAAGSNSKVKYSRVAADEDGYIDLQFKKSPPKVPYKAIALALFLFLIGSLLIIFGALLLSGTIQVEHPDRTIPVIIIGLLVFLPGFYHLRIAYYAAKGFRGYSYDDIPDFEKKQTKNKRRLLLIHRQTSVTFPLCLVSESRRRDFVKDEVLKQQQRWKQD